MIIDYLIETITKLFGVFYKWSAKFALSSK